MIGNSQKGKSSLFLLEVQYWNNMHHYHFLRSTMIFVHISLVRVIRMNPINKQKLGHIMASLHVMILGFWAILTLVLTGFCKKRFLIDRAFIKAPHPTEWCLCNYIRLEIANVVECNGNYNIKYCIIILWYYISSYIDWSRF